jgi:phosphatidylserine decarboxylase
VETIQYFNRYTRRIETEDIYGGHFLRWTYGNLLGRLSLHTLVKRSVFSRWYGWRMDRPNSKERVTKFIENFKLNDEEFADSPASYKTFNEFFYRKLKPEARPINSDPNVAAFPADARHLGFRTISKIEGIFVKGAVFDLETLLQDGALAKRYHDGSMVLSRLCPVDYHRYHFPVNGIAGAPRQIQGPLFSVNPIALRQNIRIFTENKRAVTEIDSPEFGKVLMLEVGATCVGSFEYTYKPGPVKKGQEKGYFRFGGSSTITIFEPNRIVLADDLVENSLKNIELYAKIGDEMGKRTTSSGL